MKKKFIGITSIFCLAIGTTTAYATTELTDSVGSTSSDVTAGYDSTQDKHTEYSEVNVDSTTYSQSTSVNMYATKSSTVQYSIPQTIIGDAQSGTASYKVGVKGDIDSSQTVKITVPDTFELTDGVRSVEASIVQDKTEWIWSEISLDAFSEAVGEISFSIPAGTWQGTFNFTIDVTRN